MNLLASNIDDHSRSEKTDRQALIKKVAQKRKFFFLSSLSFFFYSYSISWEIKYADSNQFLKPNLSTCSTSKKLYIFTLFYSVEFLCWLMGCGLFLFGKIEELFYWKDRRVARVGYVRFYGNGWSVFG